MQKLKINIENDLAMNKEKQRILLVGEFSGVHLELRNALREKGMDVSLFSDGDSYKKFDSDIKLNVRSQTWLFNNRYLRLLSDFLGLKGLLTLFRNRKQINNLRGYNVVQLINTVPFLSFGPLASLLLVWFLKNNNNLIFLCALGDDYHWVRHCLSGKVKYSMFDRMKWNNIQKFYFSLKFAYHPLYILLDRYVINCSAGIICGLYDYWQAYKNVNTRKIFIPLPLASKYVTDKPNVTEYPINIFHGWQIGKELRKGNDILDIAIRRAIERLGPGKINYNIVKSVPYEQYIKMYKECDIFIDQCYSYDRGMNGLLGMAAGKVVFTGFDSSILNYYIPSRSPSAINAEPNVDSLYNLIVNLCTDVDVIDEMKKSAIDFVIQNHQASGVAEMYSTFWWECHLASSCKYD